MHKILMIFLLLCLTACAHTPIGDMKFAPGQVQHVVHNDSMPWRPCPPGLPESCRMALLEGSPKNPDLYTVRFKVSEPLFLRPHTHPKDERVTILEGKVAVAFAGVTTRAKAQEFGRGDYYVNARGAVHAVWVDAGTIIQITGIGPWEVNYITK